MMRKSQMKIESALGRIRVFSDDKEIYPDPAKTRRAAYRKEFASNSTFVIATHFLKSLLSPAVLVMPSGFLHGGLIFSIFGYLFLLALVGYNTKRLVESAAYLSERENTSVRTYDEVAYVSFNTCSKLTRFLARSSKIFVNILFILTYLDACTIFMIFVARNVQALVIGLMLMSSVRDLKYLTPFSFVSSFLLLVVIVLTVAFFFLDKVSDPWDRVQMASVREISQFTSIVSFSLSGISIALTLKSSMLHPESFFSFPGVYCVCLAVMCLTFIPFGYLGYLRFGEKTAPSVMLNLPLGKTLSICIKVTAIFSVFLTSPLVFYVAFNVLWNNYLKSLVSRINFIYAEFFVRYCLIVLSFALAAALPDLGTMIVLKGALLHTHLEIIIPAILDYVTYYPESGSGKCHYRLIRAVFIILFGLYICVSGTTTAILALTEEGIQEVDIQQSSESTP